MHGFQRQLQTAVSGKDYLRAASAQAQIFGRTRRQPQKQRALPVFGGADGDYLGGSALFKAVEQYLAAAALAQRSAVIRERREIPREAVHGAPAGERLFRLGGEDVSERLHRQPVEHVRREVLISVGLQEADCGSGKTVRPRRDSRPVRNSGRHGQRLLRPHGDAFYRRALRDLAAVNRRLAHPAAKPVHEPRGGVGADGEEHRHGGKTQQV